MATEDFLYEFGLAPNRADLRTSAEHLIKMERDTASALLCQRDPAMGEVLLQAVERTFRAEGRDRFKWSFVLRRLVDAAWRQRFIRVPSALSESMEG